MDARTADLSQRWERARSAALRSALAEPMPGADHDALLVAAQAGDFEKALRAAWDNGLRLGRGFVQTYGVEPSLEALPELLASLGAPCLSGAYSREASERAIRLERAGCSSAPLGPGACAFWAEATGGLVLGLTGGIRHARHASKATGPACTDVFYLDPESPLRFGPIPEEMRPTLERAARLARVWNGGARVSFHGLSDGVLIYEATTDSVSVCSLVERTVRRDYPTLTLREASPRAVFAEGAP